MFEMRFVNLQAFHNVREKYFAHIKWQEITDPEVFTAWAGRLARCPAVTWWFGEGERLRWVQEVSYHPERRPALIKIWGIQ